MTPEIKAALKEAYPHYSNRDLSLQFGIREKNIAKMAYERGWYKTPELRTAQRRQARAQDLTAAQLEHRDAYLMAHYVTQPTPQIMAALGMTEKAVRCLAAKLGLRKPPRVGAKATAAERRPVLPASQVRPSERYARQTAAERRGLPVITPEGVKITRSTTVNYDPRYCVAPGAEVPRVFSLVPVGVDPMTGRAWGAPLEMAT